MTFYERRAEWERQELARALKENSGKVIAAAHDLGMNRQHFYKLCARRGVVVRPRTPCWAMHGL